MISPLNTLLDAWEAHFVVSKARTLIPTFLTVTSSTRLICYQARWHLNTLLYKTVACAKGAQGVVDFWGKRLIELRRCLRGTGATFIPVRVHSSSFLWSCIRLHDISTESHTGASSPRLLYYRSEIIIPVRKLISMSCKRGAADRSSIKSLTWEYGTGSACTVIGIQTNNNDITITSVDMKCPSFHVNTVWNHNAIQV